MQNHLQAYALFWLDFFCDNLVYPCNTPKHAPEVVRIGLETGPLTTWLWQALTDAGLPMVCLDARPAKAGLNMRINKTDDNDAEGLAQLVRSGWYRAVRVKSREAMLVRSLIGARTQLLGIVTELS